MNDASGLAPRWFTIEKYELNVKYANISSRRGEPDYLGDITNIPENNNTFDAIILSEVLEHLKNPKEVIKEAYRLLKMDGVLFICTPFMFPIHPDSFDYYRYTDYWYKETLSSIGFEVSKIEKQGNYFGVLANMLKLFVIELSDSNWFRKKTRKLLLKWVMPRIINKFFTWDRSCFCHNSELLIANNTGFGVICLK